MGVELTQLADTQVTITYGNLRALQDEIARLEEVAMDLQTQNAELSLGADGSEARKYRGMFVASLKVVQFAMSALDPLTVRGWPHRELAAVADGIDSVRGLDGFTTEITGDIRLFARNAKSWEDAREQGIEKEKFAAETARAAEASSTQQT